MIRRTLAYLLLTGSLAVLFGCNGFNGFRLFHHNGCPPWFNRAPISCPECSPCCDVPVEESLVPVAPAPLVSAPVVPPPPPPSGVVPVVPATPAVPVPATPSKLVSPYPQH